jgi:hypothetical protein
MKAKIITVLICLSALISIPVKAQKSPVVTEESTEFGKIPANSLVITIPEVSVSAVEKEWKSLMKVYNGKTKGSKGLLTSEKVVINTMGTNQWQVLSKMTPVSNGVKFHAAFRSDANFINSEQDRAQWSAAENLIYNFALRIAKKGAGENTAVVQKEYSKLEKNKSSLEDKQKRLISNIEKWERNIKDAKLEHEKNKKELEQLNVSMDEKMNQLNSMKEREREINNME